VLGRWGSRAARENNPKLKTNITAERFEITLSIWYSNLTKSCIVIIEIGFETL